MRAFRFVALVAGLILMAWWAHGQAFIPIETFSDYRVDINLLANGDARIVHRITIRNNDKDNPIVPGIAYLNVYNNQEKNLKIDDLSARLADGSRLVHFLQERDEYSEIRFELWFPLGPEKEQEIDIEYTAKNFFPNNGLFRTIQFPIGDSTIPIEKATIHVNSPLSISYAPNSRSEDNGLTWSLGAIAPGENKSVEFEVANVPLPNLPVKGAYVFYALVTVVGLVAITMTASWLNTKKKRGGR
jgi:hypothetical protein